jgi:hypothetical protein
MNLFKDSAVVEPFVGETSRTTTTMTTGLRQREPLLHTTTITTASAAANHHTVAAGRTAPETRRQLRRMVFHNASVNRVAGLRMVVLLLGLLATMAVWYWNQRAVWKQQEAPLDHVKTVLLKPFWAWACPVIPNLVATTSHPLEPIFEDNNQTTATTKPNNEASTKTFRQARKPTMPVKAAPVVAVVPVVMISARPAELALPVYETWSQNAVLMHAQEWYDGAPRLVFELFNTTDFSRHYKNTKCARLTFASRLFAVYQHVLTRLLSPSSEYATPPRHFVILEDDVVLLDPTRFLAELKWAIDNDVGFYSFQLLLPEYLAAAKDQPSTTFNASLLDANLDTTLSSLRHRSCVYQFSTTAQVFSRRLAQQIIDADTDSFCRLPIDMYIARAGPWYSTVHAVTRHVGKRLSLVPSLP